MILADTCSWEKRCIKRKTPDPEFARLLADGQIAVHPWVLGELMLGGLSLDRQRLIMDLDRVSMASYETVVAFIRRFHPQGVGWVDTNLLVSAIEAGALLMTDDDGLRRNAEKHGVAYMDS